MTLTRRALAGCALAAALALSGCSNGAATQKSPEAVLAAAKTNLDKTSGVQVSLATKALPPNVDGILSATGVGTHDPAFKGDLKVSAGGITADVPVVAAQGKVYAKLPFTTKYVDIDPKAYAAPDPARLMDPDQGLSSLLTEAKDVKAGKQVRSGEDVLSTYTGTVPGKAVAGIIPSASERSDFSARFSVDDKEHLREAVLRGPFYPNAGDVTYTITFDKYDTTASITLP